MMTQGAQRVTGAPDGASATFAPSTSDLEPFMPGFLALLFLTFSKNVRALQLSVKYDRESWRRGWPTGARDDSHLWRRPGPARGAGPAWLERWTALRIEDSRDIAAIAHASASQSKRTREA
jgi:hypothetical protein